jgi:hypothetical protein
MLEGVSNITFFPRMKPRKRLSDKDALHSDWEAIGKDMRKSMGDTKDLQ